LITLTHTYDPDYGFLTGIHTASVQDYYVDYYNESNEPQQNVQSRTNFILQETFSYDDANRLTGSVVEQHELNNNLFPCNFFLNFSSYNKNCIFTKNLLCI